MPQNYEIIKNDASRWGSLYVPSKPKQNTGSGLRTVLFVSYDSGNLNLRDLARFESMYPQKLNIVGVATDDALDPRAKISIRKRIWSLFDPSEHSAIMHRVIDQSMQIGVPCYTGSVKTDYFRKLFHEWNPEVLIMNCFGQKLDDHLFGYPVYGSYNFHPSNLPLKIGAGTQPFQATINSGRKSSPMVIHVITEIIDMGPIIGVSPAVNICLKDGSYPPNLITLLNKITSIGGWMGVELANDVIRRREAGLTGPVEPIDFGPIIPENIYRLLEAPASDDPGFKYEIPLHPLIS